MAVFFSQETSTFATPGTAAITFFPMYGPVEKSTLSTTRVTVRSAATAAALKDKAPARTAVAKSRFMDPSHSRDLLNAQQPRCDIREGDGRGDQHRSRPEGAFDDAIGQRASARRIVGAGLLRLPIDGVEAVSEEAQ